jgi:hypothetical protein
MVGNIKNIINKYIHFSIIKPPKMLISNQDNYQIIEINNDGISVSQVMNLSECTDHILQKYRDQPLMYFNEYKRIKVIHLKTGIIKDVTLQIEF